MGRGFRTRALRLLLGTCLVCAAVDGRCAPRTEAETLFRRARDAMRAGDYASACPMLAESFRLDPAKGTLLNLALCEEDLGHSAAALARLQELLAMPALDDARRAMAQEHVALLEQRLQTPPVQEPTPLAEQTAPAPESPLPAVAAPPPPPVAPMTPAPAAPAPPVAPFHPMPDRPPRDESPRSLVAPLAIGAVGITSLGVSAVTGILMLDRAHVMREHCVQKECDDTGLEAASTGRTLSVVSTATLISGVALTALSAYWLLQGGGEHHPIAMRQRAPLPAWTVRF